jgi:hypothetical protein
MILVPVTKVKLNKSRLCINCTVIASKEDTHYSILNTYLRDTAITL